MATIALAAPLRALACEGEVGLPAVMAQVQEIEEGWVTLDAARVRAAHTALDRALDCLRAPLLPTAAAKVHRALGLAAVVDRDLEGAAESFLAARFADPSLGLAERFAPAGTPVRALHERPGTYMPPIPLARLPRGALLVDGQGAQLRPVARPILLQQVDRDGSVVGTWHVSPGAPLPPEPWLDPRATLRRSTRVAGGVLAAVGLGLLGSAALTEDRHQDPTRSLTLSELDQLRRRSHTLTLAGAMVGGVGLATLGVGVSGVLR